jgi:hypothetical protein
VEPQLLVPGESEAADGRFGAQASVPSVAGTWKDLTDNVNFMASNLTRIMQRRLADVAQTADLV